MPYVQRDEQNNITTIFTEEVEGVAEEYLAEDSLEWIAYLLSKIIISKTQQIKDEMYRVLADGFQWRNTNTDPWFTVSIDDDMQGFLTRTLLKMNEGRVDPHGGFIRSNSINTAIDDVGIRELCIFAGTWGDAIAAIRIAAIKAVVDWDTFDPYAVDWSVNWTGADAANGWSDNTLTQTP